MELPFLIIVIAILFSAFFSGMEIAYVSCNKLRLELEMQKGGNGSNILRNFLENPSGFLSAILIGNNIALVIFSIYMATIMHGLLLTQPIEFFHLPFVIFLVQTITSTMIILIFAEFIPKLLFRINPDRLLSFFSTPFAFFYYPVYPLVWIVMKLAEGFLKFFFRISLQRDEPLYSRFDLFHMIRESQQTDKTEESELDAQIFKNAMEFSEVKIRECMVPRTETVSVDINSTPEELRKKFVDSGHSKIIVYKENIDDIAGYVHLIDIYKKPQKIENIVRKCPFVTESMAATELLRLFIEKRKSIAIVVDEFGGTSGIVTVEDLIEEIFGEIEDEHDKEALTEKKISSKEFVFSGRLEIDYLNEKYNIDIPEGDYETLGGLVLNVLEKIPEQGEIFFHKGFEFTIQQVDKTRVTEVGVKKLHNIPKKP